MSNSAAHAMRIHGLAPRGLVVLRHAGKYYRPTLLRQKKSPATLRWGGNSDRREVTMRLFRSAVLIIMLGVVGCQTASGPHVRLPLFHRDGHGGRHG